MAGTTWTNDDGLPVRFGPSYGVHGSRTAVTTGAGKRRELVFTIDLTGAARTIFPDDTNNDGTADGFSSLNTPIPNKAVIVKQTVVPITAPAGGTSYSVGTWDADGTVVDADGIRTDAGGDGAQIGTQATKDLFVSAKTTGTYTAGVVKVVVEYLTV